MDTTTSEGPLGGAEIRTLLGELDRRLGEEGEKAALYVIGGARMALVHDGERRTSKVDVLYSAGAWIGRETADEMSRDRCPHATPGWLDETQALETAIVGAGPDHGRALAYSGENLVVHTASPERTLAAKLLRGSDRDIADVELLARELDIRSTEHAREAFSHTTGLDIPPRTEEKLRGILPAEDPRGLDWTPGAVDSATQGREEASLAALDRLDRLYPGVSAGEPDDWPEGSPEIDEDPLSPTWGVAVAGPDPEDIVVPYHVYAHCGSETEVADAMWRWLDESRGSDPANLEQSMLTAEEIWLEEFARADDPYAETATPARPSDAAGSPGGAEPSRKDESPTPERRATGTR